MPKNPAKPRVPGAPPRTIPGALKKPAPVAPPATKTAVISNAPGKKPFVLDPKELTQINNTVINNVNINIDQRTTINQLITGGPYVGAGGFGPIVDFFGRPGLDRLIAGAILTAFWSNILAVDLPIGPEFIVPGPITIAYVPTAVATGGFVPAAGGVEDPVDIGDAGGVIAGGATDDPVGGVMLLPPQVDPSTSTGPTGVAAKKWLARFFWVRNDTPDELTIHVLYYGKTVDWGWQPSEDPGTALTFTLAPGEDTYVMTANGKNKIKGSVAKIWAEGSLGATYYQFKDQDLQLVPEAEDCYYDVQRQTYKFHFTP